MFSLVRKFVRGCRAMIDDYRRHRALRKFYRNSSLRNMMYARIAYNEARKFAERIKKESQN